MTNGLQTYPVCRHSGIVSKASGKRLCLLGERRKFVTLETCLACPAANADGEIFPICQPPKQPIRGVGDIIAAATSAVGIKPCGACKERQAALNAALPFAPQPPKLPLLTGPAHLMMFAYPRRQTRDIWTAQLDMIRNALSQFDGKKLLAIAVDDSTDAAAIDKTLWDEVVELPNDPQQWELPGWRWAMERLKDQPGFTVRLHAKGTVRGCAEQHLAAWWRLAYKSLLNPDAVRRALAGSMITGPFRRVTYAANLSVPWHYTGSFYAFRNDLVFSRDWQPTGKGDPRWYVEAWPALIASREQASCIAFDGVADLYHAANWR